MTAWFVPLIVAVIGVFASGGFWSYIQYRNSRKEAKSDAKDEDMAAVMDAVKGLLHQEIIRQGKHYKDRGEITKEEIDDFRLYLYLPYKKLKGDGVADIVMEELIDLSKGGIAV